jgi:hypothetical protein
MFQDIHSKFKNPPWLGFLVLGFLIGLEERYISWKTKLTVNQAIKNYKEATEEEDVKPKVVHHEDGSMSITSPWASFKDDDNDKPTFLT